MEETAETMRERERCISICNGWLLNFENHQPVAVSASDWAADAVRDIIELIESGTPAHPIKDTTK